VLMTMPMYGGEIESFELDEAAVQDAAMHGASRAHAVCYSEMDKAHLAGLEEIKNQLEEANQPLIMTKDQSQVLSVATRNAVETPPQFILDLMD
jgi:Trm5-related predicted tRNA methylase